MKYLAVADAHAPSLSGGGSAADVGPGLIPMPARLVALDGGPDIPLDRAMLVVGRHPQCHARLDSIRVSRRHCCMTQDNGEVVVCDLGSTNGIRINGQRVEMGRLRPGDELAIAHIRYRLENGIGHDLTIADSIPEPRDEPPDPPPGPIPPLPLEDALAAVFRDRMPAAMADRCRIQVIVQMKPETEPLGVQGDHEPCHHDSSP